MGRSGQRCLPPFFLQSAQPQGQAAEADGLAAGRVQPLLALAADLGPLAGRQPHLRLCSRHPLDGRLEAVAGLGEVVRLVLGRRGQRRLQQPDLGLLLVRSGHRGHCRVAVLRLRQTLLAKLGLLRPAAGQRPGVGHRGLSAEEADRQARLAGRLAAPGRLQPLPRDVQGLLVLVYAGQEGRLQGLDRGQGLHRPHRLRLVRPDQEPLEDGECLPRLAQPPVAGGLAQPGVKPHKLVPLLLVQLGESPRRLFEGLAELRAAGLVSPGDLVVGPDARQPGLEVLPADLVAGLAPLQIPRIDEAQLLERLLGPLADRGQRLFGLQEGLAGRAEPLPPLGRAGRRLARLLDLEPPAGHQHVGHGAVGGRGQGMLRMFFEERGQPLFGRAKPLVPLGGGQRGGTLQERQPQLVVDRLAERLRRAAPRALLLEIRNGLVVVAVAAEGLKKLPRRLAGRRPKRGRPQADRQQGNQSQPFSPSVAVHGFLKASASLPVASPGQTESRPCCESQE